MEDQKSWLKTYMEYTDHLEAPTEFQLWVGISAMAAVLQRKIWVHMGSFNWYPNFFILLIAEPGILQKTSTLDRAYDLVRDSPMCNPENPGVFIGPASTTWQSLLSDMGKSLIDVPHPTNKKERATSASLSLALGELGTFLDTTDTKMTDHLVDLWDCRRVFDKTTKTSGDDILPYPYLNLVAGTTPGWIRANFPRYMIHGGFTSRTIFAYATEKKQLCAYPHLSSTAPTQDKLKSRLIEGLAMMWELQGEVHLTTDAYDFGERWYRKHNTAPHERLMAEVMRPYCARKQAHLHKIALMLAISDAIYTTKRPIFIEQKHLEKALVILDQQEERFMQAVGMMGQVSSMQAIGDVFDFIKKHKRVKHADLLRHFSKTFPLKEIMEALKMGFQSREFLTMWDTAAQENVHIYPYPRGK